jgi:enoyl-CoA hydratase/carnithine racemase
LILTGRRVSAARAAPLGIVSDVVPASELAGAAARLASELAGAGPLAVTQAKRALDGGFDLAMPEALAHERACYQVVLESEDRNEGLAAFAEKRPPRFTGK